MIPSAPPAESIIPSKSHSTAVFIGQGLSLEARRAAQAERRAANTAMAAASATAAVAAERASSASPPFFANGPSPAIAGSLAPLVYAEDFIKGGRWWGGGALAGR
jgi:hypothetical protein